MRLYLLRLLAVCLGLLSLVQAASTDVASPKEGETATKGNKAFLPAFISAFTMIVFAELGDKTFFIAAIGSLKNPRMTVFLAAAGALVLMTVLSTGMGMVAGLISHTFTHWLSTILFVYFGFKLLYNAYEMGPENDKSELEEVEHELEEDAAQAIAMEGGSKDSKSGANPVAKPDADDHKGANKPGNMVLNYLRTVCSPVFAQFFFLTFVAEWGDRSQVATVTLAATDDPLGVTLGALIGHLCCTGLAVVGGKVLATSISERTVTFLGGITFLACALWNVFDTDY